MKFGLFQMKFKLRNNNGLSKSWSLSFTKTSLNICGYYSVIFGNRLFSRTSEYLLWESQSWSNTSCWSELFK